MKVVDIAGLTEQLQCLVFGDIIRSVYSLKHGDYDPDDRSSNKPVPKKIVIFVDELNKYAPSTSSKNSPLLANLLGHCLQNKQSVKFSINSAFFIEMCYNKCKKIIKSNKKACT